MSPFLCFLNDDGVEYSFFVCAVFFRKLHLNYVVRQLNVIIVAGISTNIKCLAFSFIIKIKQNDCLVEF